MQDNAERVAPKNPLHRTEPGVYETKDGRFVAIRNTSGAWYITGPDKFRSTGTDLQHAQMIVRRALASSTTHKEESHE